MSFHHLYLYKSGCALDVQVQSTDDCANKRDSYPQAKLIFGCMYFQLSLRVLAVLTKGM